MQSLLVSIPHGKLMEASDILKNNVNDIDMLYKIRQIIRILSNDLKKTKEECAFTIKIEKYGLPIVTKHDPEDILSLSIDSS